MFVCFAPLPSFSLFFLFRSYFSSFSYFPLFFSPLSFLPLPLLLFHSYFFSFSYLPLFFPSPFSPSSSSFAATCLLLYFVPSLPPFLPPSLPPFLRRSASAEVRRERSRLQREVESLKEQLATRVANEKPASSGGGANSETKSLK